jgi:hypothetical protein
MLQKIVDVAHCVTDVLGVLATFSWAIPAIAPASTALMAICVVGDIMAFGAHSMNYLAERSKKGDLLQKPTDKETQKPPPK